MEVCIIDLEASSGARFSATNCQQVFGSRLGETSQLMTHDFSGRNLGAWWFWLFWCGSGWIHSLNPEKTFSACHDVFSYETFTLAARQPGSNSLWTTTPTGLKRLPLQSVSWYRAIEGVVVVSYVIPLQKHGTHLKVRVTNTEGNPLGEK